MRTIAVVVVMLVGIAGAMFSRFLGLLLYFWFALFRPQEWTYGSIVMLRPSLIAGVTLVVPALVTGVYPDIRHRLSRLVLLFLGLAVLSQTSFNNDDAWMALDQLTRNILVALLAVTILTDDRKFIITLLTIVVSLGFHTSKFGVGSLIRGGATIDNAGIGGMFSDNNDFALASARVVFLLLTCALLVKPKIIKAGFLLVVGLTIICVISTNSRGGFLALVGGFLTLVLAQKRRVLATSVLTATVALGLLVVPLPEKYADRLTTIWTYRTTEIKVGESGVQIGDNSALGRLHYWQVALKMVSDKPLGVGVSNYPRAYDRYDFSDGQYGKARAVHSSHMQALAETGFLGAAVWVILMVVSIYTLIRIRARSQLPQVDPEVGRVHFILANGLLASMIAFVIGGTFLAQMLNDLNWFSYGLIAALDNLSRKAASASIQLHDKAA